MVGVPPLGGLLVGGYDPVWLELKMPLPRLLPLSVLNPPRKGWGTVWFAVTSIALQAAGGVSKTVPAQPPDSVEKDPFHHNPGVTVR